MEKENDSKGTTAVNKEADVKSFFEGLDGELSAIISKRGLCWIDFSFKVLIHIEEYTIPQYGDKGDDQITEWSAEDCLKAVKKRIARHGRNSREGQQMMDFLKMAHEVQIASEKYEEGETEVITND